MQILVCQIIFFVHFDSIPRGPGTTFQSGERWSKNHMILEWEYLPDIQLFLTPRLYVLEYDMTGSLRGWSLVEL